MYRGRGRGGGRGRGWRGPRDQGERTSYSGGSRDNWDAYDSKRQRVYPSQGRGGYNEGPSQQRERPPPHLSGREIEDGEMNQVWPRRAHPEPQESNFTRRSTESYNDRRQEQRGSSGSYGIYHGVGLDEREAYRGDYRDSSGSEGRSYNQNFVGQKRPWEETRPKSDIPGHLMGRGDSSRTNPYDTEPYQEVYEDRRRDPNSGGQLGYFREEQSNLDSRAVDVQRSSGPTQPESYRGGIGFGGGRESGSSGYFGYQRDERSDPYSQTAGYNEGIGSGPLRQEGSGFGAGRDDGPLGFDHFGPPRDKGSGYGSNISGTGRDPPYRYNDRSGGGGSHSNPHDGQNASRFGEFRSGESPRRGNFSYGTAGSSGPPTQEMPEPNDSDEALQEFYSDDELSDDDDDDMHLCDDDDGELSQCDVNEDKLSQDDNDKGGSAEGPNNFYVRTKKPLKIYMKDIPMEVKNSHIAGNLRGMGFRVKMVKRMPRCKVFFIVLYWNEKTNHIYNIHTLAGHKCQIASLGEVNQRLRDYKKENPQKKVFVPPQGFVHIVEPTGPKPPGSKRVRTKPMRIFIKNLPMDYLKENIRKELCRMGYAVRQVNRNKGLKVFQVQLSPTENCISVFSVTKLGEHDIEVIEPRLLCDKPRFANQYIPGITPKFPKPSNKSYKKKKKKK